MIAWKKFLIMIKWLEAASASARLMWPLDSQNRSLCFDEKLVHISLAKVKGVQYLSICTFTIHCFGISTTKYNNMPVRNSTGRLACSTLVHHRVVDFLITCNVFIFMRNVVISSPHTPLASRGWCSYTTFPPFSTAALCRNKKVLECRKSSKLLHRCFYWNNSRRQK